MRLVQGYRYFDEKDQLLCPPSEALCRTCNETLCSGSLLALCVSFLLSPRVLCRNIHIEPKLITVCSPFQLEPVFLLLTKSGTCLIICTLQMGGIDEAALDKLSLVTEMTRHIRVRASSPSQTHSSASEIGQFSPIFLWLLRVCNPSNLPHKINLL